MISFGDESVFIGNPVNGVSHTFANECVLSSRYSSRVDNSDLFLLSTFDHSGAIIDLVAVSEWPIYIHKCMR